MAQPTGEKKRIEIDISSDTACPWCYVAKKNLDKAMDSAKNKFHFEVKFIPLFFCINYNYMQQQNNTSQRNDNTETVISGSIHWQVRWHPFFLNAGAQTQGIKKSEFYASKFGAAQYDEVVTRISEVMFLKSFTRTSLESFFSSVLFSF